MSLKHKVCGNCFSKLKGKKCSDCGYSEDDSYTEYDVLPVGTELNGRYIIGRLLGKGGFGITYLAYDQQDERAIAIKEYYPDRIAVRSHDNITVEPMTSFQANDFSEGLECFLNEAAIIMQFRDNSDIMGLYDIFRSNGTAYYAMEYFNGVSLKKYVENKGTLTEGQAVHIAEQLLPALSTIHSGGVLHRDITPENIILCSNGCVKLIDFGSARSFSFDTQQSMSIILKEGYAPLEQYQRKGSQNCRTDIYSLAMSLYYGCTGLTPENPIIRLDDDSDFENGLKKLSDGLSEIIKKAAAVREKERYTDAQAMLADIKSCGISDEMPIIEDIPTVRLPGGKIKKNKISTKAKVFITLSAVLCLITAFFFMNKEYFTDIADIKVRIGDDMYSVKTTELDLQNRELTNAQISNLRHMKSLKSLNLADNYLTDLSCLDGLSELEYLKFSNNNVSDISFMQSMKNLKHFSANNNSISDISVLSDMTGLEYVFLGDNYITDISPLKNSRGLLYVSFDEAQLDNIDVLEGMDKLIMAGFSGCNLTSIEPLRGCTSLKKVYFGRNQLTDVSPLVGCNIEELYLDNNLLSRHTDTFKGITLNGFACMEGNGFTEEEIQNIVDNMNGDFDIYY